MRSLEGLHLQPEGLRPAPHDVDHLRVAVVVDEERCRPRRATVDRPGSSPPRRRWLRRGAKRWPSPFRTGPPTSRLEVEQHLEATLGDLGLVRRVGGVPRGVLDQVAEDHRRGERVVPAGTDEAGEPPVAPRRGPVAERGPGLRRRVQRRAGSPRARGSLGGGSLPGRRRRAGAPTSPVRGGSTSSAMLGRPDRCGDAAKWPVPSQDVGVGVAMAEWMWCSGAPWARRTVGAPLCHGT